MSIDELKRIINFAASVAVDAGQPKIASQLDEAVNQFCQLQERLRTAEEKSGNWDYYQELLKKNGLSGITDLLTKFHALDRNNESLRQQLEAAQGENERLQSIIKKAQEQAPVKKEVRYCISRMGYPDHWTEWAESHPGKYGAFQERHLYALPPIPTEHGEHKWISVEEKLPDPAQGNKIIAYGRGYVFECEFDDGLWCNIGGDQFTHWMPYFTPQSEVKPSC